MSNKERYLCPFFGIFTGPMCAFGDSGIVRKTVAASPLVLVAILSAYPLAAWSQTLPEEALEHVARSPARNWEITLVRAPLKAQSTQGQNDMMLILSSLARSHTETLYSWDQPDWVWAS